METLECSFADSTPGRLACEVAGEVICSRLDDGSVVPAALAGTLYVLLHEGTPEPWQVPAATEAGYTLEVQYGDSLVIPPPPEPDPPARRSRSS